MAKNGNDKTYRNTTELAFDLNLNLKSVLKGLKRGEIPGQRVGRRYVVSRDAIRMWLAGGKQAA